MPRLLPYPKITDLIKNRAARIAPAPEQRKQTKVAELWAKRMGLAGDRDLALARYRRGERDAYDAWDRRSLGRLDRHRDPHLTFSAQAISPFCDAFGRAVRILHQSDRKSSTKAFR